jgi:hypothetical protein
MLISLSRMLSQLGKLQRMAAAYALTVVKAALVQAVKKASGAARRLEHTHVVDTSFSTVNP